MSRRPAPEPIQFDHHSPAFAADPSGAHARMRAQCPLARSDLHGGFWVLNNYDVVHRAARSADLFSSRHDVPNEGPYAGITIPESSPYQLPPVESDPPEHQSYRRLLNPAFAPAAIDRLAPAIGDIATWCIDQRVQHGSIDFVVDIGNPVPAMATMLLLGLPLDDWEAWAAPLHDQVAVPPHSPDRPRVDAEVMALGGRLVDAIAEQRRHPRVGLLSELIAANVDGRPLDDASIVGLCFLLLAAGVDTTTALISGTIEYLDRDRATRQRLIADPSLQRAACEEFVRYLTPNPTEARTVTTDVELGGVALSAGDRLLISWYAANHDPAAFEEPDRVVLDRFPNRHAGFGLGIHRCVGSHLARAVYAAIVPSVLARLGDYELDRAGLVAYEDRGLVNGFVRMPGSFSPGPVVGAELPEVPFVV